MIRLLLAPFAFAWCFPIPAIGIDVPKTPEETEKITIKTLTDAKADFKFTAKEWHDEFKKGKDAEQAAKAKYRGKIIEIEDEVSFVTFQDKPPLSGVYFKVDRTIAGVRASCWPAEAWKSVVPKSKTKVRGYYFDKGLMAGDLFPCIVVGTDLKLEKFKAEELAKEVATNPESAAEKYKDKWCCIEGKYLSAKKDKAGVLVVTIEGNNGKNISCGVPESAQAKVDALKTGQIVKVFGELSVLGTSLNLTSTIFD